MCFGVAFLVVLGSSWGHFGVLLGSFWCPWRFIFDLWNPIPKVDELSILLLKTKG